MIIRFLGHASFLITTAAGTRILTDPFDPADYGDEFTYGAFTGPVEVITLSHEHRDHSGYRKIKGSPVIIKGEGKFGAEDAEFLGVATYHDSSQGAQRGRNTVFVISADGLRIAHMGDLGHVLTADQAAEIGNVDVALIPVGGYYTIDAEQAEKVAGAARCRHSDPDALPDREVRLPDLRRGGFRARQAQRGASGAVVHRCDEARACRLSGRSLFWSMSCRRGTLTPIRGRRQRRLLRSPGQSCFLPRFRFHAELLDASLQHRYHTAADRVLVAPG